jgi:hypothetical protein
MKREKSFDRIDAIYRYAAADKSDPFAFNRAMSHLRNGICEGRNDAGELLTYNAEETYEERVTAAGAKYRVTVYKNCVRP